MYDKTMANLAMIRARKGPIIALATEGDEQIKTVADDVIYLPKAAGSRISDPGDRAAAIVRLSHRRRSRLRRGQAAQSGQKRHSPVSWCGHSRSRFVCGQLRMPHTIKVRDGQLKCAAIEFCRGQLECATLLAK